MTWKIPSYLQDPNVTYTAADDRFVLDTLFTEGILNVPGGQGLAVQRPAGANMQVYVPALDAIIKGDDAANQGSYLARMTDAEFVTVTAAPTTNPRIDLIVAEVIDSQYRTVSTANPLGARLRVVAGTPAASPVVPTLPATAIPIAQVAVAVNAASIVNANLTDLRTRVGGGLAALAATAEPLTATQIAALTTAQKFRGRLILNVTTGKLQQVQSDGATPTDVAPASFQKAQGTYTGTGVANRAITVGFAPDLVLISIGQANGNPSFGLLHRTETTYNQGFSGNAAYPGEYLTGTGFIVGSQPAGAGSYNNSNGSAYAWTAYKFS